MKQRLVAVGLAVLAAAVVSSGSVPALAFTLPGDSDPCLESTGSLTLSATTVFPGQPVVATWRTHRPSGCGGVASQLTGPGAAVPGGVGGSATLTPPNLGVNTYTVTAFYAG